MQHTQYVIGVDEVGRGPLAGPVVVGAVCMVREQLEQAGELFLEVRDSKRLSEKKREAWYERMCQWQEEKLISVSLASVSAREIDQIGIARSLTKAVADSLAGLSVSPKESQVFLDGSLRAPSIYTNQRTIIGGDDSEPLISLASIFAKVSRDRHMVHCEKRYPAYGFSSHKGYGTAQHMAAIRSLGPCALHRRCYLGNILNTEGK